MPSLPSSARMRRLLVVASAVLALSVHPRIAGAQPTPPAAPPLTQQAQVDPGGFTVRFPAGWSLSHDANVWRLGVNYRF